MVEVQSIYSFILIYFVCLCRLIGLIVFGVLLRNQTHFGPCSDSAFIHRRGKRKLGASEFTPPSISSRMLGVRAPFCCRVSSLRVKGGNTQCPCEHIICIFHIPFSVNSQYLEAVRFNLNQHQPANPKSIFI